MILIMVSPADHHNYSFDEVFYVVAGLEYGSGQERAERVVTEATRSRMR